MAACEQSDQEALDHILLTDDCSVNLGDQLLYEAAFVPDFLIDFIDMCGYFHRFSLFLIEDKGLFFWVRSENTILVNPGGQVKSVAAAEMKPGSSGVPASPVLLVRGNKPLSQFLGFRMPIDNALRNLKVIAPGMDFN